MQERTVTACGETVTLYDSGGIGPAVVLVHGNSHHFGSFSPLLANLPGDKYRLIGIDLPGHGKSPPARSPETCYSLPGYAELLVEVVDFLAISEAVFTGHSLGGHIVLEALPHLPSAVGAFVMGTPPVANSTDFAEAFLPNPAGGAIFQAEMSQQAAVAFDALLTDLPAEEASLIRNSYHGTDSLARAMMGESIMAGQFRDEQAVINISDVSTALISSTDDPLINPLFFDYLETHKLNTQALWRGGVQRISGCGHWFHIQRPNIVSALLTDFLDDCHGNFADFSKSAQ